MAINYEELFGDDFLPILEAIDKGLPNNVENMVLGQLDKMVFATESFTNRFEKTYQNLVAQGVGPEQIKKLMTDDMSKGGKLFGTLRNEIKEDVVNTMNQASRLGQFEEYGTSDIFTWVTVGGHKICGDCDSRAGEMKSYNDWAREGLPGSGWSVCGGYCYCVLDPVGRIDSKLEVARKAKLKAEKGATVAPQATQVLRYATSRSHAKAIVRQANAVEPDITGSIDSNVEGVGGKMTGLKYRMKGQESLARKLIDYNKLEGAPIPSILSESINDVIRYTGVFDDAGYVNGINQTIATLESQGYKILKVKNKWGDDGYKGVHYILESDTKHRLELQFHTKKSIHVKEKFSHPLYEEMRAANTTQARKDEIELILAKKWAEVDRPKGWETIGKKIKLKDKKPFKSGFEGIDDVYFGDPGSQEYKANMSKFNKSFADNKEYFFLADGKNALETKNPFEIQVLREYSGGEFARFNSFHKYVNDKKGFMKDPLYKDEFYITRTSSGLGDVLTIGKYDYEGTKTIYNQLTKTLKEAPNFKGTTYRGFAVTDDKLDDIVKQFGNIGDEIKANRFWSTSADVEIATDFTKGYSARGGKNVQVKIEIEGKTGTVLDGTSGFEIEKEVLFNQGTKFKIKDFYKTYNKESNTHRVYVALEEI